MKISEWNGFKRIDFEFNNRNAIVVFPKKQTTDRWLIKTEYFDAFPNAEIALLDRGFHLAYLENINRWGTMPDQDVRYEFVQFISHEYHLSKKCIPVGMSCGGLHAVNFTAKYPDCVEMLYLDAPVLNLLSCPGAMGNMVPDADMWQELVDAYGFTRSSLITYREHPIDKLDILTDNKIPVLLVYGDVDTVVPYCENGAILEKHYREKNCLIKTIEKKNCGHHPHGLEEPAQIVDFIVKMGK